jgi:hypothetical protein
MMRPAPVALETTEPRRTPCPPNGTTRLDRIETKQAAAFLNGVNEEICEWKRL